MVRKMNIDKQTIFLFRTLSRGTNVHIPKLRQHYAYTPPSVFIAVRIWFLGQFRRMCGCLSASVRALMHRNRVRWSYETDSSYAHHTIVIYCGVWAYPWGNWPEKQFGQNAILIVSSCKNCSKVNYIYTHWDIFWSTGKTKQHLFVYITYSLNICFYCENNLNIFLLQKHSNLVPTIETFSSIEEKPIVTSSSTRKSQF